MSYHAVACSVQVCVVQFVILVHLQKLGVCIKVCFKVGYDGTGAVEMLELAFGEQTVGKRQVLE